jgi:transcription initiation factor TFIID subunit TAF12
MLRSALRIELVRISLLLVPLGALMLTIHNGSAQQQSGQQQSGQQQQGQQQSGQQQSGQPQQGQQGTGAAGSNSPNSNGSDSSCGGGANNSKPAPLFCGSLKITKAKQTGDNTSLGFNGLDPNGQIDKAALNGRVTADSMMKVRGLATYHPSPADLARFQQDGGLTAVTPVSTQR